MIKLEMEVIKEGDIYFATAKFEDKFFCGSSLERAEAMDRCFTKIKDHKEKKVEIVEIVVDDSFNIQENG